MSSTCRRPGEVGQAGIAPDLRGKTPQDYESWAESRVKRFGNFPSSGGNSPVKKAICLVRTPNLPILTLRIERRKEGAAKPYQMEDTVVVGMRNRSARSSPLLPIPPLPLPGKPRANRSGLSTASANGAKVGSASLQGTSENSVPGDLGLQSPAAVSRTDPSLNPILGPGPRTSATSPARTRIARPWWTQPYPYHFRTMEIL